MWMTAPSETQDFSSYPKSPILGCSVAGMQAKYMGKIKVKPSLYD